MASCSTIAANKPSDQRRNYRTIFGSQIHALKHLNDFGPADEGALRPYYEAARAKWADIYKNFSFEVWLQFLIGSGLLERVDGKLRITIVGNDFLQYLPLYHMTENKIL